MHTVDLLEEALSAARAAGFQVRKEWLDGVEGGICEFGGKQWIFLDPALSHREQLDQLVRALQIRPTPPSRNISRELQRLVRRPAAA
ncbi:hypothetical protein [Lignipirellula cremea]|uniref:Uncharacterized protein n=1 Tax=Lignipirellula cremea TaxID=2528010 RepID=A0A518E1W9_9BACT|nr:hypothetical protein [Lignipirellula cremea]QDU98085.1 hypothetical protein Pla8534_59460 [Lignipirellula cremea]